MHIEIARSEHIAVTLYGHIYVGRMGDRLKVGISVDPERRRRQLETGAGSRFDEWESFHVYAPGACERYLHQEFAAHRLQGEWFDLGDGGFDLVAGYLRGRQTRAVPA